MRFLKNRVNFDRLKKFNTDLFHLRELFQIYAYLVIEQGELYLLDAAGLIFDGLILFKLFA